MRKIKIVTFGIFGLTMAVMAVASVLDNVTGRPGTSEAVYGSAPFAAMWGVLAVLALIYMGWRKLWRMPATMLIHVAFAVILCGALVTHIWGEQGRMHLREGETANWYVEADGHVKQLTFAVRLDGFEVERYAGTSTPKDYVSQITLRENGKEDEAVKISMNNIATHRHYRFYQSDYDDDLHGSILLVTHDPWGIGLTYTGYGMLLVGMLLFWWQRNSQYSATFRAWRTDRQTDSGRVMRWLPYVAFVVVLGIVGLVMWLRWTSAPLQPVLRSPFFPLHVSVIMISYVLLAFVMVNGFRAMCLWGKKERGEEKAARLMRSSQLMLMPALCLLTAGIFVGAVWANVSWGRYWGWDSKEVWALITMMFYALPLHQQSLRWFANPRHFHAYCAVAFLVVLMTYFGVNYFLAGLHSYAGS